MKKLIMVLIMVSLCATAFASDGRIQRVFNEVPLIGNLGTNGNTVSTIYQVQSDNSFGVWVDLGTPGALHTPSVDISLQMSYDKTDANFATVPTVGLIYDTWTGKVPTITTIVPTPMKYLRFKANGNSANTTGTTITMYMFSQGH